MEAFFGIALIILVVILIIGWFFFELLPNMLSTQLAREAYVVVNASMFQALVVNMVVTLQPPTM
ncbi:MAG: hypothetical protein HC780_17655 [Leptolyngbyaceae cyanobacterium CSU_1_3]|nr:hypothetical protein [Leptolyngbyaceae cyanobacterium CSU_1_3]